MARAIGACFLKAFGSRPTARSELYRRFRSLRLFLPVGAGRFLKAFGTLRAADAAKGRTGTGFCAALAS